MAIKRGGINSKRVAMNYEAKGDLKRAADFYTLAGDWVDASRTYRQFLSETEDWGAIKDVEIRLKKHGLYDDAGEDDPNKKFAYLIKQARERSKEATRGASRPVTYSGFASLAARAGALHERAGHPEKANSLYQNANRIAGSRQEREHIEKIINEENRKGKGIEKRAGLFAILAFVGLAGTLAAFSANMTGNAIGNLGYNNVALLGTISFIFGTLFTFLLLRSKN